MLPDLSVLPLPLAVSAPPTSPSWRTVVTEASRLAGARLRLLSPDGGVDTIANALLDLALAYAAAARHADAVAHCALAGELAGDGIEKATQAGESRDAALHVTQQRAAYLRACMLAQAERFDEAADAFQAVEGRESAVEDITRWQMEAGIGAALCQATLGRGLEARRTLDSVLPRLQTWITAGHDGALEQDARMLMLRFGLAQVRMLLALHRPLEALRVLEQVEVMMPTPDLPGDVASHGDPGKPVDAMAGQVALLRAAAFLSLDKPMQAVAPLETIFVTRPDDPAALVLYGQAMSALGEYAFAVDRFEAALRAMPRFAPAYRYMASALAMQKSDDAALVCLRAARDIRPDFPEVWLDEAGIRLRLGQLRRGFAAYEWRDGARLAARRSDAYWNGDDVLTGRSLLVAAEQGLGDAIQFLRYIPLVRPLARDVIVEVPVPLWRLVAACADAWGVRVIPRGEPLPDCDRFTLLMSLPYAMQTTLSTIPSSGRYFAAAPALSLSRPRQPDGSGPLEDMPFEVVPDGVRRLRVGLVVSGNPEYRNDAFRSMPLSMCAPLFALDGVEWIMLQPALRDADRQWIDGQREAGHALHWRPGLLERQQGDFADTAGLIETLDLVISVDTAIAHLTGALGVPVWILLPFVADWRWLSNRSDSPWYPSARLFRQPALQDWPAVIAEVAAALMQRLDG
ncbi:hypothetical protein WM40_06905 [Robbsia andropogonis]|uniref:Uncharacterized protein n=1 Tax=Robbsia andropogonis TaxID=28092 RepID=A0A0F5K299_9BURK|nr:tetratricopeptide repeat-containing glycosyltransferase family protein [Robbsia andropogonis]KKB64218.1 hypothetical protein WM40_06905 [Robbsia andropogonis]